MKKLTSLSLASALLLGTAVSANAQMNETQAQLIEQTDNGIQLTTAAVSGNELLSADLDNGFQQIGQVDDIVLSETGDIQFIRYETTMFRDLDEQGYLPVGTLEIGPQSDFSLTVEADESSRKMSQDQTYRIEDIEQRILSEILRNEIIVEGDGYEIRDVVFTQDGQAEYFLVGETSGGFLQDGAARAVSYDNVYFEDGVFRTEISSQDLVPIYMYIG